MSKYKIRQLLEVLWSYIKFLFMCIGIGIVMFGSWYFFGDTGLSILFLIVLLAFPVLFIFNLLTWDDHDRNGGNGPP